MTKVTIKKEELKAMLAELQAKVAAGEITIEAALEQAAVSAAQEEAAPRVDFMKVLAETNTIEGLQKLYKKAAAKMSSAKRRAGDSYLSDKSYSKFRREFEAVQTKMNEVHASVSELADRVEAAIKAGEKLGSILQAFMNQEKEVMDNEILKIKARKKLTNTEFALELKKMPNKPTKEMIDKMEGYLEGLSQAYLSRNENDQFVIKLNQMSQYIMANRKEVK